MAQTNATHPGAMERQKLLAERDDADLRWVLSDPRGRRFLWRELGRCGLHAQTYSPNNSEHCFRAGERNAAIRLNLDIIRVSPELYLTMQQEAIEEDGRQKALEEQDNEHDD
jgi:hypothetical protein